MHSWTDESESGFPWDVRTRNFTNPNGFLTKINYTTAHDMALIAQAAYNNATFRKVCQTTTYCIGTTNKVGKNDG